MKPKSFREDINGLRAIAVLSVLIFHFNPSYLPGGFVGVDVFFVISGFLMTSIIFRGIGNNSFSTWNFLKARAKRIVPALTTVIIICLLFGYLCFDVISYKILGQHSAGSLTFISNYIYQYESGYFDESSRNKVLLHTWSLSVEWQFYIIYPIILSILSKFISIDKLKATVLFLMLASLLWCIYISQKDPVSSYFMIYSRAWEMMLGGLAFLYPINTSDRIRKIIEIIGLLLIAISFFIVNETMSWPGYYAVIPVIGAYFCILSGNKKTILSWRLIQYTGLWSYSIYLVHWPVLVFLGRFDIQPPFILYLSGVFLTSLVIYQLVERKRDYHYGMLLIYIATLAFSLVIYFNGADWRLTNKQYGMNRNEFRKNYEGHLWMHSKETIDYFNADENDFDYIVLGDSHARHYYAYFKDSGLKVASLATDGCKVTKNFMTPIDYSENIKNICTNRYKKAVDFINSHPGKKIIWMQAWYSGRVGEPLRKDVDSENNFVSEIGYFLDDIKSSNSKLYIIGDTQGSKKIMYQCLASKDLPINRLFTKCEEFQEFKPFKINERFSSLADSRDDVVFIDPSPALCDDEKCKVLDGDEPVYTDNSHLTIKTSKIVGEYIFDKIK
ncbi:acyltransferase family protein [Morganella morganii]|uniref:acyltransferase family protein n=1 Tax=Morganella morganii TaxID=582 RepID=UPI001BDAEEE7|nr:acyltransferase family protein [Morganella morganii]MBT0432696.1 acyltransferase [Morganella morganii subsp. morganii]HCT7002350.1 acyltransferase [Morganella morganii]